ncbi:MAG: ATP-binding cassette domain-containing protein [Fimbriimonadaceae bacterium]|nr:ATP-binding cassette domain-containing protein [Fimbriimonadaceae bacterium]
MQRSAPYIQFDRVDVGYSDVSYGLRGISLTISRGEFVFLCGLTGSGKSTLIKVLTREVKHTDGRVLFDGQDLSEIVPETVPALRRKMGIVPQDFGLLPNKKVWENVGYAMRAVGRTRREVSKAVPVLLERVNILHRADQYPKELSGGERQRGAIARALINNPPLLLADEPTANLDPEHSVGLMQLLEELNRQGMTIIVATHDMPVVEQFGRRIVRLEFGRIVEDVRQEPLIEESAEALAVGGSEDA